MYLIVGVTGVLGRETARALLKAGLPVRGLTRFPENAADLKALGAEIVQGDLIDRASLERACSGVEAVLGAAHQLMGAGQYTMEAVDGIGHRTLVDAAKAAGVKHFVYTSMLNATSDSPVDFVRNKAAIETYVQRSGISYTILRPPAFMEWHAHNLLGKSLLETGKTTIYGAGNNPINFMAGRDVAYFAVLALTDPCLKNRSLDIGGADNVTKNQVAAMYGRFAGITPKVTHVPVGVMKVMGPILHPFQPVLSRLMALSVNMDTVDWTFNPQELLKEFPITLTCLDDFVREQVAQYKRA